MEQAAMMSLINTLPFRATRRPTRTVEDASEKDQSVSYVVAFAAFGLLVTLVALALDLDVASF